MKNLIAKGTYAMLAGLFFIITFLGCLMLIPAPYMLCTGMIALLSGLGYVIYDEHPSR